MNTHTFDTVIYLLPIDQLQEANQGTLLMAAELGGSVLPWLQEQGGSYQELILHIMPTYHFYFWTCLWHNSIPTEKKKKKKGKLIRFKATNFVLVHSLSRQNKLLETEPTMSHK